MLYDIMPKWLRAALRMESAVLPTDNWTWRHTCRYGSDPAMILRDEQRYRAKIERETP